MENFIDDEKILSGDNSTGSIKISVDVVATIAGIAAEEVKGVNSMYTSFAGELAEKFGAKKSPSKGVKVEMGEDDVTVDLYLVIDYGIKIPDMSWEVQENVKNNIETMTGLKVLGVNVHIEGVSFENKESNEVNISETNEKPYLD